MQQSEKQTVFRFLDLPPEIRLMVYSHVIHPRYNRSFPQNVGTANSKENLSILQVNHQIYEEANEFLKSRSTFTFHLVDVHHLMNDWGYLRLPKILNRVMKLEIELNDKHHRGRPEQIELIRGLSTSVKNLVKAVHLAQPSSRTLASTSLYSKESLSTGGPSFALNLHTALYTETPYLMRGFFECFESLDLRVFRICKVIYSGKWKENYDHLTVPMRLHAQSENMIYFDEFMNRAVRRLTDRFEIVHVRRHQTRERALFEVHFKAPSGDYPTGWPLVQAW